MSIVPLRWGVSYDPGRRHTAYVAIFRKDGTVCITHGGVEIGQGIDTKVFKVIMDINARCASGASVITVRFPSFSMTNLHI